MFDAAPFSKNTVDWMMRPTINHHWFDTAFPAWMLDQHRAGVCPFEVDVKELDSCYVVEADLPGMRREDIRIAFENQWLHIEAQRMQKPPTQQETPENEPQGSYLHQERFCGKMKRSFFFEHIRPEGITAGFQDGVLKVTLPKNVESLSAHRNIPIASGK